VVGRDAKAREAIVKVAKDTLAVMSDRQNGYGSPLTAKDYVWGSNSLVLNRAMLLALAYDFTGEAGYLGAAAESMNYLLGRNTLNFSFISGYGVLSLSHPHHRFWANQPSGGYPPPPPGVVAGGPNGNPDDPTAKAAGLTGKPPAKCYVDEMGSFTTNEVAINWNAPLAWMAAYMDDTGRPILSAPQPTSTAPRPVITPTAVKPIQAAPPQAGPDWGMILAGAAVILVLLVAAVAVIWRQRKPPR
jgi:endoglucanase